MFRDNAPYVVRFTPPELFRLIPSFNQPNNSGPAEAPQSIGNASLTGA